MAGKRGNSGCVLLGFTLNAARIWASDFAMTAMLVVPAHSHDQPMPRAQSAPSAESRATREVPVANMELVAAENLDVRAM